MRETFKKHQEHCYPGGGSGTYMLEHWTQSRRIRLGRDTSASHNTMYTHFHTCVTSQNVFGWWAENRRTQREPTETWGEHESQELRMEPGTLEL